MRFDVMRDFVVAAWSPDVTDSEVKIVSVGEKVPSTLVETGPAGVLHDISIEILPLAFVFLDIVQSGVDLAIMPAGPALACSGVTHMVVVTGAGLGIAIPAGMPLTFMSSTSVVSCHLPGCIPPLELALPEQPTGSVARTAIQTHVLDFITFLLENRP